MAIDDLANQGTRVLAGMELILFRRNIPASALQGFDVTREIYGNAILGPGK